MNSNNKKAVGKKNNREKKLHKYGKEKPDNNRKTRKVINSLRSTKRDSQNKTLFGTPEIIKTNATLSLNAVPPSTEKK